MPAVLHQKDIAAVGAGKVGRELGYAGHLHGGVYVLAIKSQIQRILVELDDHLTVAVAVGAEVLFQRCGQRFGRVNRQLGHADIADLIIRAGSEKHIADDPHKHRRDQNANDDIPFVVRPPVAGFFGFGIFARGRRLFIGFLAVFGDPCHDGDSPFL